MNFDATLGVFFRVSKIEYRAQRDCDEDELGKGSIQDERVQVVNEQH
jgi:hypothetical protein